MALDLVVTDKKFFLHVFPVKANVKHVTPRVGSLLAQGYNLNKLGKGLIDDDTKYRSGFTQEDFSCFTYISQCKTFEPRDGTIFGLMDII